MLKYKFYKNDLGTPIFHINGDLEALNELGSCNYEYLQEIIMNLTKVKSGEIEQYDFGYEVFTLECQKEISKIIDTFDDWKCIAEVPTQEIYNLMKDWKDYLDGKLLIENDETSKDHLEISFDYIFFDGKKVHQVTNQFDDWLSSVDYSVWSNSYIEIKNKRIYIIKENVKILSTLKNFDQLQLELLSQKYNLKIKEENGIYYAYTDNHNSGQFQISQNNALTVIYCFEGGKAPESIFILGVFEN
jgi:hypothetical protein